MKGSIYGNRLPRGMEVEKSLGTAEIDPLNRWLDGPLPPGQFREGKLFCTSWESNTSGPAPVKSLCIVSYKAADLKNIVI